VRNLDPKGYYALLNVSPTVTQVEIRLSFEFLKQAHKDGKRVRDIAKIHEAYDTLGDAKSRAQYNRAAAGRPKNPRLNSGLLLLGLAVVFTITVAVLFGSDLIAPFVSFDAGDSLYWKTTQKPLGVVLEYEETHAFPEGPSQAAYRIRLSSGDEQWFVAADLHRNGIQP